MFLLEITLASELHVLFARAVFQIHAAFIIRRYSPLLAILCLSNTKADDASVDCHWNVQRACDIKSAHINRDHDGNFEHRLELRDGHANSLKRGESNYGAGLCRYETLDQTGIAL